MMEYLLQRKQELEAKVQEVRMELAKMLANMQVAVLNGESNVSELGDLVSQLAHSVSAFSTELRMIERDIEVARSRG